MIESSSWKQRYLMYNIDKTIVFFCLNFFKKSDVMKNFWSWVQRRKIYGISLLFFKQLNHIRQSNQSFSRFDNSFIIEATPLGCYLKAAHDELDIVFKTLYTVTLRAAAKTHTRSARFTVVFFSQLAVVEKTSGSYVVDSGIHW